MCCHHVLWRCMIMRQIIEEPPVLVCRQSLAIWCSEILLFVLQTKHRTTKVFLCKYVCSEINLLQSVWPFMRVDSKNREII